MAFFSSTFRKITNIFRSKETLRSAITKALRKTGRQYENVARKQAIKNLKPGSAGLPKISQRVQGTTLTATGEVKHQNRPLDLKIVVPPGGFVAKEGSKGFPMKKPEGLVFRKRTYTRHGGKVLRLRGYFSEANDAVITSGVMYRNLVGAMAEPLISEVVQGLIAGGVIKELAPGEGFSVDVRIEPAARFTTR